MRVPFTLFSFFISICLSAQTFNRGLTADNGEFIGFLEFRPSDYSSSPAKHPLIIFLHGVGEKGNGSPADLKQINCCGIPSYIRSGTPMRFTWNSKTESFVVLSPQLDPKYTRWQPFYINSMIDYAINNLRIDPNRIFISGLSLGGHGSWGFAQTSVNNAKKLAGIVPVSPVCGEINACNIANANLPILAIHAKNDTYASPDCSLDPIRAVIACGIRAIPNLILYPTGGHSVWVKRAYSTDHSYQDPNVYEWMLAQNKLFPPNKKPTANAGPDASITKASGQSTLNASQSFDSDGKILKYSWRKISGPSGGTISSSASSVTNVTGMKTDGNYQFELKIIDDRAEWSFDTVLVKVGIGGVLPNVLPIAQAGEDATILLPKNSYFLDASKSSDPDGNIIAYKWTLIRGSSAATFSSTITSKTIISNLDIGGYVIRLKVTDNKGGSSTDDITLFVKENDGSNISPVSKAGTDVTLTLPTNSLTLNGSASSDPDGSITKYEWSEVSGPVANIATANAVSTAISNLVEGTYVFRLKVTDDKNAFATDDVTITVNPVPPAANKKPIANAGSNKTITLPVNSITLDGSASSDPDGAISKYEWTKISGPVANIATANAVSTAINNLVEGTYVFRLKVTDDKNASATDDVTVTVNPLPPPTNKNPVANAGSNKTITLPVNTVTLNGSKSSDSDGIITKYEWTKVSGPAATIATATMVSTAVNNLVEGTYVFRLKVADDAGATATDDVSVVVNPSAVVNKNPIANAGANKTITLPANTVTLDGSGSSDPDGTISKYEWTKVSGPAATISPASASSTSVNNLVEGSYVFRLKVTDNQNATATDDVSVTVKPAPVVANKNPIADAGTNKTITLPVNSVTLNGSASSDPDGSISKYEWSKVSGPSATIVTASAVSTAINNLLEGTYVFRLKVTDNKNATATDDVSVIVKPAPVLANKNPIADAGTNKTITLPINSVTLNGSASSDPDGTISKYEWSKVSGPAATIATASSVSTAINNLLEGTYVFRLKVTDNKNATATDDVSVTVNPAPVVANKNPVADAGTNKTITLPVNSVTLNGSTSSDPDGSISKYEWSKVSGPTATIVTASAVSTAINNLLEGTYVFRLKVTDNKDATANDDVTVTVKPAPVVINKNPIADAGTNKTITLPVNSVILNGSASSDADGTISKYHWTKVSGPAASIAAPASATTAVNNLVEGTYVFRLSVTDNKGATANDEVSVTVKPAPVVPNKNPVAEAGANKTITLPINTVTLDGSASSDPDGAIAKYAWIKVSGPAASIGTPSGATTSVNNLVEGTYVFRLTVTDNKDATATDDVTVIVKPETPIENKYPLANAGSNKNITLPINTVTLNGSASSDPDGTISKYEWTKVSGPAATIATATTVNTGVNNLVEGTYIFRLKVTDNDGATATDDVTVIVNPVPLPPNQDPEAVAGANKTITLPVNTVTLNGSASSDADGTISKYHWTKVSGPAASIAAPASATTAVNNLVEGTYVFRLSVTDNKGATANDEVSVTVKPAPVVPNKNPVAEAGANKTITLPIKIVTLDGSASSDPDGTISKYAWIKVSGPVASIATPAEVSTSVNNLTEGSYVFRLTVTDNKDASASDEVSITVKPALAVPNKNPVAEAGANKTITLPINIVTLNGSASSDSDGTISKYEWIKVSGPAANIATANAVSTAISNLVEGTYVFRLKVTDDKNAFATDDVIITVNPVPPAANKKPVAIAGSNKTITLPVNTITLDGSASSDPDGTISKYAWIKVSGPSSLSITTPAGETTVVNSLVEGTYVFQLTVTDDKDATATDDVTVIVKPEPLVDNQDPVANAGSNKTITLPINTVTLNGSASSDPDGTISKYEWIKVSGPVASIATPAEVSTSVNNLTEGTYVFRLTVTDNKDASASDEVSITVKPAPVVPNKNPVAEAGANKTITLPIKIVTLDGSASSDPDGTIAKYQWTKVSGPAASIATPAEVSTSVNNLMEGTYVFRLTVTDNKDASASDEVSVTVKPAPVVPNKNPVAEAGANKTITLPINTVTLDGSASSDPDGTVSKYEWIKVSGPAASIAAPASATIEVNNLVEGTYVFRLKVTDNDGATATDDVTVIVKPVPLPPNQDPVANAGSNKTITLPINTVTLDGSASSDPDGTISKYEWTKVSGPAASIAAPANATTEVNNLVEGTYVFRLSVTDNKGATANDEVSITVKPAPVVANKNPIADAGTNKTITLPVNSVTLNGSTSSDPDGTISKYEWTKVSGPAASIAAPANATTEVNNLVEGTYVFSLTITDDKDATATDDVTVTVKPAPQVDNQDPVANAGSNKTITLPINTVTLDGSKSSDPDGAISKYEWLKVSGPSANIATASSVTTTVNNLIEGAYVFRLKVTDDQDATSTDEVSIVVNPAVQVANIDPVADAGTNQNITLPENSITLDGSSSSDPDGSISSYEWTKMSGPPAIIETVDSITTKVNELREGTYLFQLQVTDDKGASSTDEVTVIVNPEGQVSNQAPKADAGENFTITLPLNTKGLNGSRSSDPDGSIVSYFWYQSDGPDVRIENPDSAVSAIRIIKRGTYSFKLEVTDNSGASAIDEVTIKVEMFGIPEGSISKNDSDNLKVNISPNPARSSLHLRFNDKDLGKTRITVYDSRGQMIQLTEKEKMGAEFQEELNIMKLNPGLYYLEIILPDKKKTINKFIKLP